MSDSFEKRRRQREKQRRKKEKAQRKKDRDSRKGEGTIDVVSLEDLIGEDAPGAKGEEEPATAPGDEETGQDRS